MGLSGARQKKGISLQQVVEKTKISMRYLHAIESEHFTELPGGVFALNYLRQYAEAAGFDAERLVNYYSDKVSPRPREAAVAEEPRSLFDRLIRAVM